MTSKETEALREKIIGWVDYAKLSTMGSEWLTDQILQAFKKAGWKSPREIHFDRVDSVF